MALKLSQAGRQRAAAGQRRRVGDVVIVGVGGRRRGVAERLPRRLRPGHRRKREPMGPTQLSRL